MSNPLVSILTTAYNREKFIAEAIESVLSSTYTNLELIIVDDCSFDNTVEIAKSYESKDDRVKVFVNKKNLGDYPNRNKAAGYAKGRYIKYLDSDDIIYPHGLEVMVKSMELFPEAGFGLCAKPNKEKKQPYLLSPHETYVEHFYEFGHFHRSPTSGIIKKSAFDLVEGFSGKRMIGDFELWLRLGSKFPMVSFPRDLVWNRIHESQELNSKYAKNYKKLRTQILDAAIADAACPLTNKEKSDILNRLKKKKIKESLLNFFGKF